MRPARKTVLYVILALGLLVFLEAPVAYVNAGGQYFWLGVPITPNTCSSPDGFGCHCIASGSLIGILLGLGYRQFLGCP